MASLDEIRQAEDELTARFQEKLVVNHKLNRTLVSFQGNKAVSGYRWFKYKEGFSADLVLYLLQHLGISSGRLLDPFAGSGSALFAAATEGINTLGIELLPIGCEIIKARCKTLNGDRPELAAALGRWLTDKPWKKTDAVVPFPHLRITKGAFPSTTEKHLGQFLSAAGQEKDDVQALLRFAATCVLEETSYTRKDGQYLRWDYRSGRQQGNKPFDKGPIPSFHAAIEKKLRQIREDLAGESCSLFPEQRPAGAIELLEGSCLAHLPAISNSAFDCLITSPPYCNRYDYTRTYALELALLGIDEEQLKQLRQAMVSCTVENRDKSGLTELFGQEQAERARKSFAGQAYLQRVLQYLEKRKEEKLLNNNGIPRMVRNYFWEMTLIIHECARVLKPGAPLVMVNDNVRYEGANIPVDLILSDLAEKAGFTTEMIWVLPVGKGNSSQQMGKHGRNELRKCVYIWRAPTGKPAKKQARKAALAQ